MSYLTSAMKQSQQGVDAEQDYFSQRQSAQLAFYKKLVIYAGAGILSLTSLGAGYYLGKVTATDDNGLTLTANTAKNSETKATLSEKLIEQPPTEVNPQIQTVQNTTPLVTTPQVNTPTNQTAAENTVNTDVKAAQPEQHFQWVSVQVGVDSQGQPLYQQQLVPVDSVKAVPAPLKSQPRVAKVTQDSSPGEIQTEGEYAGYRVFGKTASRQEDELAGVSDELKKAFAAAVKETESHEEPDVLATTKDSASVTPIGLLPARLQNTIPSLRYQAHIYATEAHERWIKINNRPLYEGDSLGALTVVEITPEQTRFDFDGIEFSLEAMEDWLP